MTTVNIVSVLRKFYILERRMFKKLVIKLSCGTAQIPGIGFSLSPTPTH